MPRAAFGVGQGGTVHQPCQITRVAAKAGAAWVISGSAPHFCLPILMPLAPFLPAPSQQCMFPPERGWQEVKGSSSQLLAPSLLQKDCRDPGSAVGDSASCRVPPTAEPRQNQWIVTQKPHSADLLRCGTWESCILTSPYNSCILLLYFQCTITLFVWHLEGVKWCNDKYDCYYPPVYPRCTA